jgi:hypothetical protein
MRRRLLKKGGKSSALRLLSQLGVGAGVRLTYGRAERHPLSGVGRWLPWSYVMVYAPRDDEEYQIWTRLVVAGCRFVSGGKEIKLVVES